MRLALAVPSIVPPLHTIEPMELYSLGDDYIIRYPAIIRAVTREEIQAVVRKYLDVERFALAIAGPYQE